MSDDKPEKLVIFGTHGPEDPERACLPFVIGNAALVMEVQVTIMLQGGAVFLAKEGCYEHVFAAGLPPLKDLIQAFIEQGGTLLICFFFSPATIILGSPFLVLHGIHIILWNIGNALGFCKSKAEKELLPPQ